MKTKESNVFLLNDFIANLDQIVKYFHGNGFPNARAEYNYDLQFFSYIGIFKHMIWANSARIGLAYAFDNVPISSERFYTGSGTSVRGNKFDSLGPISPYTGLRSGGESMLVLNQELKIPASAIGYSNIAAKDTSSTCP